MPRGLWPELGSMAEQRHWWLGLCEEHLRVLPGLANLIACVTHYINGDVWVVGEFPNHAEVKSSDIIPTNACSHCLRRTMMLKRFLAIVIVSAGTLMGLPVAAMAATSTGTVASRDVSLT